MIIGETIVDKWVQLLNESLIHLLKRQAKTQNKSRVVHEGSMSFNGCQICRANDHMANDCPKYATSRHKCLKCGGLHKTKHYGLRFNLCGGLGHIEKICWNFIF